MIENILVTSVTTLVLFMMVLMALIVYAWLRRGDE
jgi:Mg2+ and Co2+ transporter CorA